MRLSVPVHIQGEAKGTKEEGGLLDLVLREIQIECLPSDIPSHITVDVTNLVWAMRFASPICRRPLR